MGLRRQTWVGRIGSLGLLAAALAGCGGGADEAEDRPALRVDTRDFSPETEWARYFLHGDGIVDWAVGAYDDLLTPTFPTTFNRLPEGRKDLLVVGYDRIYIGPSLYSWVPEEIVRETGRGSAITSIVGGATTVVVATIEANGSDQVGVSTELLNGAYDYESTATYAGNQDGSNVAVLVIHGADPNASVTIGLNSADTTDPCGLYFVLPEPAVEPGEAWADPSTWATTLDLTTDSNGDANCYLVAKPTRTGHLCYVHANGAGLNSLLIGQLVVRVAGTGALTAGAEL